MRNSYVSVLIIILGNVLYALTVRLFLIPAGLITGGSTGIALFVHHLDESKQTCLAAVKNRGF